MSDYKKQCTTVLWAFILPSMFITILCLVGGAITLMYMHACAHMINDVEAHVQSMHTHVLSRCVYDNLHQYVCMSGTYIILG